MAGMDKVVTITGNQLRMLAASFEAAAEKSAVTLKVCVDDIDQAAKFKWDDGTWSPPLGTLGDH
jgi:hypothetical protein